MIADLDETIRTLLNTKYPVPVKSQDVNINNIEIDFDRPDKAWEEKTSDKLIRLNCFLYDIRENLHLRSNDRSLVRNGAMGIESYAPTRIDFTYLISVWRQKVTDSKIEVGKEEHNVLGQVLKILLRYPTLPTEVLAPEIASQPQPPRTWIAQPEDTPKTWEFWGGNEWRLKAGISYRVTLHIQPEPVEVGLVTETEIRLQIKQQINSQ